MQEIKDLKNLAAQIHLNYNKINKKKKNSKINKMSKWLMKYHKYKFKINQFLKQNQNKLSKLKIIKI